MRKIYKHFMALALLLMLQVSTAFAVNVTYSLTTHVDHRTITGTASVNSGASLENGMPRALWRANTTYKYYSDPELTQEITVAPAEKATRINRLFRIVCFLRQSFVSESSLERVDASSW